MIDKVSNDIGAVMLPWRFTTPLHKNDGARVIRSRIVTVANQPVPLLNFKYGPGTIDRVIGVKITNPNINAFGPDQGGTGYAPHQSGVVVEMNTGTYIPWNYGTALVCAFFNVETLLDGVNLQIISSYSGPLYCAFYNFEIGQSFVGR